MRVLQVYNNYTSGGGGETEVVETTHSILGEHGHFVHTEYRDNRTICRLPDKISAFFSGIYSVSAAREMQHLLTEVRPDVVHVHNLYPLFSPSVLRPCHSLNIPVVMTVHNFGLTCPTAAHFHDNGTCERCMDGREYSCVINNCKENYPESVGYALRRFVARKASLFTHNITTFIATSDFVRAQMIKGGYPQTNIVVIPNSVGMPEEPAGVSGEYVGYIGGLNAEKGVGTLLSAARISTDIPVKIAGDGKDRLALAAQSPASVEFLGRLNRVQVQSFYKGCRMTVVPSLSWEAFGLVVIEAMSHGLPVVAARSGALQEIVEHDVTGLLYTPGDATELAAALKRLWHSQDLCHRLGKAGRAAVQRRYSLELYYHRLLEVYTQAILSKRSFGGA